jgi:glutamate--cysteine ligase
MTTSQFTGTSPRIESAADLLLSFTAGEKPKALWRVGTEHEKLGFVRETHEPLAYEGPRGIRALLEGFARRFGWQTVIEGPNVIALTRDLASITLEPGGQFELSGAPLASAHESRAELDRHLAELSALSRDMGLLWLNLGRTPLVASARMPMIPKERYAIMRRYLPTRGAQALDMMMGTGTVQTNFDYCNERDMARKLRLGMAAAPFITALYANSPFAEGRPSGMLSARANVWRFCDPDRCGIIPAVFREDFGYQDYVNYALDVPMFFIHRGGHYRDTAGRSFREFLERGFDGERPTQEDWTLHLTTLFPEARLKSFIELRMADVGSPAMIVALAALTRGLFYDESSLKEAGFLLRTLRPEHMAESLEQAIRHGIRGQALGRPIRDWLRDLLQIAHAGLERLNVLNAEGRSETVCLEPLQEIVDSGQTQADRLLARYETDWQRRLDPIFAEMGYPQP